MPTSCKAFQDLIIERTMGVPLRKEKEEKLREHLVQCPACQRFLEDMARILGDLRATSRPPVPEALFRDIRKGVLETLGDLPPAPTRIRERILRWFQGTFMTRSPLLPAMTGGIGVLVGIAITVMWLHLPTPLKEHRNMLKQPALPVTESTVPTVLSSTAEDLTAGDIESYIGTDRLFDTIENQDLQPLLSQWSEEVLGPMTDAENPQTG